MKYLENIKLSKRNEYEVTDALTRMSLEGKLYGFVAKGYWNDVGTPLSVLESNAELMKKNEISIEENVEIENCEIEGPCFISKNVVLKNVKVKPYSFIGEDCVIEDSEIFNSMVLEKSKISSSKLQDCLIGTNNKLEENEIKNENGKFGCVSGPNVVFEKGLKVEKESKIK
jgi:glucose-1-phosphate thymidylyltransferase